MKFIIKQRKKNAEIILCTVEFEEKKPQKRI